MADTEGQITAQKLWDIEQIEQLKARYFRLIDTKDWEGFRDLFTDDCVHHLPQESGKGSVGNDEYLSDMARLLGDAVTVHHGHTPEITLLGPTEAQGIWAMSDAVQVTLADGTDVDIHGYGHYVETYRKGGDGRWRISSKRNTRLRLDQR